MKVMEVAEQWMCTQQLKGTIIGAVGGKGPYGTNVIVGYKCALPDDKPAQSAPANITVNPVIQTTVSPQVSPVFQQQFQPQNSPATAGTTQLSTPPAPVASAPTPPAYVPGTALSTSAPLAAPASAPPPAYVPSSAPSVSPYPSAGYSDGGTPEPAPDASTVALPAAPAIDWKIPALLAGGLVLGFAMTNRKGR